MTSLLLAAIAGVGAYLLCTHDRVPVRTLRPSVIRSAMSDRVRAVLDQAGLEEVRPAQFLLASVVVGGVAAVPSVMLFGPGLPALVIAVIVASTPSVMWRSRRLARRRAARGKPGPA